MSNVFVLTGTPVSVPEYSLFGYETVLPGSMITGEVDPTYPAEQALDFRDNTEFSPLFTGEKIFVYEQSTIGQVDYFGLVSKNARDANLKVKVEIFDLDINGYVEVANFTDIGNAKPALVYFGDQKTQGYYDTVRQRITITADAKVFILSMYCGKALIFPHTPSLGFVPAHVNPQDEVENFKTDGNNFTIGRRIPGGYSTKGVLNFIPFEDIDGYWPAFQQHVLNSRPMYWAWSNNRPNQVIYGLQNVRTLAKPSYVTSCHAHLDFEINGYA